MIASEVRPATLAGLLKARAAESPDRGPTSSSPTARSKRSASPGASWTPAPGPSPRRCAAVASLPGERALLLYPPGLEFVAAFFGCLYAGVVAVPAYPPRPRPARMPRLRAIARDARPRLVLTTAAICARRPRGSPSARPSWPALRWIATDELDARRRATGSAPELGPGRAGLPPVHLRLDRDAQGGDGHATATCCTTRR